MSISSSTGANSQSSQGVWAQVAPYVAPLVAAPAAIVATAYGFIVKSAQQLDQPVPKMGVKEALLRGCSAAPTVGVIIGLQVAMQKATEIAFANDKELLKKPSLSFMLGSSAFVGTLSVIPLAIFNGQMMTPKMTPMESVKALSIPQSVAIVGRETLFVFGQRMKKPLADSMKPLFGDTKVVEYGAAFASGAIGSLAGHAGDTIATRLPKGMEVKLLDLMKGAGAKTIAVGLFSVVYKAVEDFVNSTAE